MKGSRVQAIIRELRGEKIDIIEWSEEPSVFAANSLSPAKVNQVRITDIESRQMEVIVNEDQLSLAIGKRGQNVRLATKLVGWNIDIRSEEEIKKEVAEQMGAIIASGGAVPLTALEGVTAATSSALAEHGIEDIDALAALDIDTLVEMLDTSLDEAQAMLDSAQAIVAARERSKQTEGTESATETNEGESAVETAATAEADATETEGEDAEVETASAAGEKMTGEASESRGESDASEAGGEEVEQHAYSAEADPNIDAEEVKPSNAMTDAGYDEAVEHGEPFHAGHDALASDSADPVALSEVEQMSIDQLALQDVGRDLRPDTITPAPGMTSTEAAVLANAEADDEGQPPVEDDSPISPTVSATEVSAPEHQISSKPAPARREQANDEESADGNEKRDASQSAE
jgi:N utilization substance protein A